MAVEITPRLGLKKYTSGNDLHPNRTEFNAMQDLMERLVAIAVKGTTAQRPSAGTEGRFYWSTDAARLYYDDGKAWLDVNPNGGGGAGTTVLVAGTAQEGTSSRSARADHSHNLPLATASAHGGMSKADKAKLDAATGAATPLTIALRNDRGQVMVGTPTAATHAAHKEYVDGQIETRATAEHSHNADDLNSGVLAPARLPGATRSVQGALSASDKTKLDSATSGTTGGTLVMRADNGQFQLPDPTADTHGTNKRYVDALGAQRLEFMGELGTGSINSATARGVYTQSQSGPVTVANGYPVDGGAGTLVVLPFGNGTGYMQQEWTEWIASRRWLRATNDGGKTWRAWTEQASTATATAAKDGLMASADKAKLDKSSSGATPGALVIRDANGDAGFRVVVVGETTGPNNAARKDYVDAQITTRAAKQHAHPLSDIEIASLTGLDLNDVVIRGLYHQNQNADTSLEKHYPVAMAGLLEVFHYSSFIYQRYSTYKGNDRVFTRGFYNGAWGEWKEISTTDHKHNGADITSGTIHPDRIANATASLDGLMAKGDKAKLDAAHASIKGSAIVMRDGDGAIHTATPTIGAHATRKDYVDGELAKKANASHSHGVGDLPSASTTSDGLISAADKKKLDAATYLPTPGTLVTRHATAGTIHLETGVGEKDGVNKGYVDGELAKKANSSHKHSVTDLNPGKLEMTQLRLSSGTDASETSTGHAFQIGADNATNLVIDNNEIVGRVNGKLDLISMPGGLWGLPAPLTGSTATNKDYVDGAEDRAVARAQVNTNGLRTEVNQSLEPLQANYVQHFTSAPIVGPGKPTDKPFKHFMGSIWLAQGAGGEDPNAAYATGGDGIGGVWFGYNGLPKFNGVYGVQLINKASGDFVSSMAVLDVNLTRIKFQARRLSNSNWANGYGSFVVYLDIWGW